MEEDNLDTQELSANLEKLQNLADERIFWTEFNFLGLEKAGNEDDYGKVSKKCFFFRGKVLNSRPHPPILWV